MVPRKSEGTGTKQFISRCASQEAHRKGLGHDPSDYFLKQSHFLVSLTLVCVLGGGGPICWWPEVDFGELSSITLYLIHWHRVSVEPRVCQFD